MESMWKEAVIASVMSLEGRGPGVKQSMWCPSLRFLGAQLINTKMKKEKAGNL
jgi:hypothetical protein